MKVDLPALPRKELRKLARNLQAAKVQLLAEKVETAEEFELCRKLGFDPVSYTHLTLPTIYSV